MRISGWSSDVCSSDRRGELVLAAIEPVLRRTIQGADVARDIARVLLDPTAPGAGRKHGRHHESGGEHAQGGARRGGMSHAGGIATAPMNAKKMMEVQGMSPCGCGAYPDPADSELTPQPLGASARGAAATGRASPQLTPGPRVEGERVVGG